jgi:hypothetical protein
MVKFARTCLCALAVLWLAAGATACNQIAGIANYEERAPGDAAADAGAAADSGADASARADASAAADADAVVPADTGATSTPDAATAPERDAEQDAAPAEDAAAATPDSGTEASTDAGASTPCFQLSVSVTSSASGAYTSVAQHEGFQLSVAVGASQSLCLPANTMVDLRAEPDEAEAAHSWATSACPSPARRCQFLLTADTVVSVALE